MNPLAEPQKFLDTAEQTDIITKAVSGKDLKVTAYAGAGKTTTLVRVAQSMPNRLGIYLAFNADAKKDAAKKFKGLNVEVYTTHGLANRWFRDAFPGVIPSGSIYRGFEIAEKFRLQSLPQNKTRFNKMIHANTIGAAIADCINGFCNSGDTEISIRHFKPASIRAIPDKFTFAESRNPRNFAEINQAKRDLFMPYMETVRQLWRMISSNPDRHPISHDVYLKLWSLSLPRIDCDYIMLDEAQDTNGAVIAAINGNRNTQKIIVGDSYQQIYSFRGATDAMKKMQTECTGTLSKSFRYGECIGDLATAFLQVSRGADVSIRGFERVNSVISQDAPDYSAVDCVICRTNEGAIVAGLEVSATGRKVKLNTGSTGKVELINKLTAISELITKGNTEAHPDYEGFDYGSFASHLESSQGAPDNSLKNILEKHGIDTVKDLLEQGARLRKDVVEVTTAHKSKGLEWGSVVLWGDFPAAMDKYDGEEGNLLYVALTRAKTALNISQVPVLIEAMGEIVNIVRHEEPQSEPMPEPQSDAPVVQLSMVKCTECSKAAVHRDNGGCRHNVERFSWNEKPYQHTQSSPQPRWCVDFLQQNKYARYS